MIYSALRSFAIVEVSLQSDKALLSRDSDPDGSARPVNYEVAREVNPEVDFPPAWTKFWLTERPFRRLKLQIDDR